MKNIALAALVGGLFATPAAAQQFTGPYIGVHAGYGGGDSGTRTTLSGQWAIESQDVQDHVVHMTSQDLDPKGALYGGQVGYSYQTPGNVVVGAEADFSLLDIDDREIHGPMAVPSAPSLSYTAGNRVNAKHMYSLRGKLGYAIGKTMIYAHGGYAWVKAEYDSSLTSNGGYLKAGERTKTSEGLIYGAGIETKFTNNVSGLAEVSYTNQGHVSFQNAYLPGSTFTSPAYNETSRQSLQLVLGRVGVNFRF
jgi:outer membrane immunogenic protein